MTKGIFFPDEQYWSVTFGPYEWVIGFLRSKIDDAEAKARLQLVLDANLGAVNLTNMSATARRQILHALGEDLEQAVDTELVLQMPEFEQQQMRDHIKRLAVIARQQVDPQG